MRRFPYFIGVSALAIAAASVGYEQAPAAGQGAERGSGDHAQHGRRIRIAGSPARGPLLFAGHPTDTLSLRRHDTPTNGSGSRSHS